MSATSHIGPEQALGNSVVLQAVRDYRDAVKILSRGKRNKLAEEMRDECVKFFKSEHFNYFSKLDGTTLLLELEKEAEHDG
nr:MAG TPA: hypothetical protein [Caudoviricetes sp.]